MTDHWKVIEGCLEGEISKLTTESTWWEDGGSMQKRILVDLKDHEDALVFVREQQLAERTPPTPSVPLPPYHIREVATMASNQVWKPVEPGTTVQAVDAGNKPCLDGIQIVKAYEYLENAPRQIIIVYEDFDAIEASVYLPDNIRLCQLVESDAPAAVIPPHLVEEIRALADTASMAGQSMSYELEVWLDSQPADDA